MSTTAKLNPRNFPRPPLCERTPRHLQVVWNDTTIAETKEAFWVLETYHPPTYYLPPSSLKIQLEPTPRRSYCEWKGQATYYAVTNPNDPRDVVKDRIWSYDSPTEGFKGIKGFLSFYAGPWECFVDGEKVEAQPGDFYGGWMTSDIERSSVKGAPVPIPNYVHSDLGLTSLHSTPAPNRASRVPAGPYSGQPAIEKASNVEQNAGRSILILQGRRCGAALPEKEA